MLEVVKPLIKRMTVLYQISYKHEWLDEVAHPNRSRARNTLVNRNQFFGDVVPMMVLLHIRVAGVSKPHTNRTAFQNLEQLQSKGFRSIGNQEFPPRLRAQRG